MDTLTHIALGAIIGEAVAGKKLGKKALILGAFVQSLPDIDFLAAFWLSPAENLLAHRGITHSFTFLLVATPILAQVIRRSSYVDFLPIRTWIFFFGIQLSIHILLDSHNAYGVSWLEPFNESRFAFNTLFVADPFFSMPLGITFLALVIQKSKYRYRFAWASMGLLAATFYVAYAWSNKLIIQQVVEHAYASNNVEPRRNFTTPAPFNSWLWYAVAEVDSGYYISYHSVYDNRNQNALTFFPKSDSLFKKISDQEEFQTLLTFSDGYNTVEQWGDTLVFNDLRFGQIAGWENPRARFAFHYYLGHAEENKFVVQRGRLANWNSKTIASFIERIQGK